MRLFNKILLGLKGYINRYFVLNVRRIYNTIYYKLGSPNDFIIVNCSFKQWGNYIVPFNIGDDINAIVFHHLSGKKVLNYDEFFHKPMTNILGIGSIIEWKSRPNSIIWGSGIMDDRAVIPVHRNPLKVLAVRGKLTKQILEKNGISCPNVFGDPALLLPQFYRPSISQTNSIGIVPHYVDLKNPILKTIFSKFNNVKLIDLQHYKKWQDVVNEICSCKYIISSSLHGLILSDAYKIPNVWVKFSDKIAGNDFKYYDYFSAVNRSDTCLDLRSLSNLDEIETTVNNYKSIVYNVDEILSSFPLNEIK